MGFSIDRQGVGLSHVDLPKGAATPLMRATNVRNANAIHIHKPLGECWGWFILPGSTLPIITQHIKISRPAAHHRPCGRVCSVWHFSGGCRGVTLLDTFSLCVLKNVVKLSAKTSQFAGTIQNPTPSVSSKKFRLMVGPSRSFFVNQTWISNSSCLGCSRYIDDYHNPYWEICS